MQFIGVQAPEFELLSVRSANCSMGLGICQRGSCGLIRIWETVREDRIMSQAAVGTWFSLVSGRKRYQRCGASASHKRRL